MFIRKRVFANGRQNGNPTTGSKMKAYLLAGGTVMALARFGAHHARDGAWKHDQADDPPPRQGRDEDGQARQSGRYVAAPVRTG